MRKKYCAGWEKLSRHSLLFFPIKRPGGGILKPAKGAVHGQGAAVAHLGQRILDGNALP